MEIVNTSKLKSLSNFANRLCDLDPKEATNDFLITNALKIIKTLKKTKKCEYNNQKTSELLRFMTNLTLYCESEKVIEEILKQDLIPIYSDIIVDQLENKNIHLDFIDNLYLSLTNLSDFSPLLANECTKHDIFKYTFDLLDRLDIINTNKLNDTESFILYRDIVTFISNSSTYPEIAEYFVKINLTERLLNELTQLNSINSIENSRKEITYVKLNVFITIGNLVNEQKLEDLSTLDTMIKLVASVLNEIVNYTKNHKEPSCKVNKKYYMMCTIQNSDSYNYATDYLSALKYISVSDKNKQRIFEQGIISLYDEFLVNGTEYEKEMFIDLLFSLSFNENVVNYINKDEKLKNMLKKFERDAAYKVEIRNSCQQILKILNKTFERRTTCIQTRSNSGLIWISYCKHDKRESLIINEELKKKGYNTSHDLRTAVLDSYYSTTENIANASIVLICYSKDYKMNNNCRLEAEYSLKLNKRIIAVKLKSNYEPDGWLSNILNSSTQKFDFSNDIYDHQAYDHLIKEINIQIYTI